MKKIKICIISHIKEINQKSDKKCKRVGMNMG